jgi:hypothetical protein
MSRLFAALLLAVLSSITAAGNGFATVEYMIITNETLAPEFQRFAQWKIDHGIQAEIRTVEWIDTHYPAGVDAAERVRLFICDAYAQLGTLWILIGGDAEIVPVRHVQVAFSGRSVLCDYYYMCLDGDWNADGDDLFGEVEDEVDLQAEVFAGRATVSNADEVNIFIDKTIAYEMHLGSSATYPVSSLLLAERLLPGLHGADLAEEIVAALPPWFHITRLYEESASYPGSFELTRSSALDAIIEGYGLMFHIGRGGVESWSVGDSLLAPEDIDRLTNAPRYAVAYADGASTADFDTDDAIGEHWLTSEDGGCVAYVGYSDLSYVSAGTGVRTEWLQLAFEDSTTAPSVGALMALARAPFVELAGVEGPHRSTLFALHLLGDPHLQIRSTPETTGIPDARRTVPTLARLAVSPNPFNPDIAISFHLAQVTELDLRIYDAAGRCVRSLLDGRQQAGTHTVRWDGRDAGGRAVASGVYFVQLEYTGTHLERSIVLAR